MIISARHTEEQSISRNAERQPVSVQLTGTSIGQAYPDMFWSNLFDKGRLG
jgi:hypothetical protein